MVTVKDLKEYDFKTIEDYFHYILESKANGNFSQVENLFKKLSKPQRIECLTFLLDITYKKNKPLRFTDRAAIASTQLAYEVLQLLFKEIY